MDLVTSKNTCSNIWMSNRRLAGAAMEATTKITLSKPSWAHDVPLKRTALKKSSATALFVRGSFPISWRMQFPSKRRVSAESSWRKFWPLDKVLCCKHSKISRSKEELIFDQIFPKLLSDSPDVFLCSSSNGLREILAIKSHRISLQNPPVMADKQFSMQTITLVPMPSSPSVLIWYHG